MAVNRTRKLITVEQESADLDCGTLGQAAERIASLIERYGKDATLDMYQTPYDDGRYLYVYIVVPETDEHMASRIAQEESWEKQREENDKREFDRLQKKFAK